MRRNDITLEQILSKVTSGHMNIKHDGLVRLYREQSIMDSPI